MGRTPGPAPFRFAVAISMKDRFVSLLKRLTGSGRSRGVAALLLAIGMALSSALVSPWSVVAQEGTALLVNDEATANPELVPVDVTDPSGLGVEGLTLQ